MTPEENNRVLPIQNRENAARSPKKGITIDSVCLICRGFGFVRDRKTNKDVPCPSCGNKSNGGNK